MRYITSIKFNLLGIIGILVILAATYFMEFAYHELPCPLCLLQRLGFLAATFGLLLNLKYGNKMQHYGFSLLGALYAAAVAIRQILLHINTASETYGPALFGYHLYTWSFLIAVFVILFVAMALMFEPPQHGNGIRPKWVKLSVNIIFICVILFSIANTLSAFAICGFGECPDNPTEYIYHF